jgi:hypothetical protein
MWGAASMTMPMVHRDIDPYEKSIYILVCSLATEANLTGIQTDLSCAKNCPHQMDGPLGCNIFETARIEIVHDMGEFCIPVWFQFFFCRKKFKKMFCVFTIDVGIIGVEKNDAFVPWKKFTQRPKEKGTKKSVKWFNVFHNQFFKYCISLILFSAGDDFGRPRSFRAPFFTRISRSPRSFVVMNSSTAFISSSSVVANHVF